jgi:hypothetical protein
VKIYLEIMEKLSEEEMTTRQPQQLRIEVSSKEEALKLYEQFKPLFEGRSYVAQIHYCRHDEGKPCEIEKIEEV